MSTSFMKWLLPSVLLFTSVSWASPPVQEISLGAAGLQYQSFFRPSPQFFTLELSYMRSAGSEGLWKALRLGGGLRTGIPVSYARFPLEAFARAQLTVQLGVWE
jgi:hypothetical protein